MGVFNDNAGQSAELNVCQSVFAAKSPNLISVECTTPMVCIYEYLCEVYVFLLSKAGGIAQAMT